MTESLTEIKKNKNLNDTKITIVLVNVHNVRFIELLLK